MNYYFIYKAILSFITFVFLSYIICRVCRDYPVTPDDKFFIKDLDDDPED